jgi:hypothetical protein
MSSSPRLQGKAPESSFFTGATLAVDGGMSV